MGSAQNVMENMYSKLDDFLKTETVIGDPIEMDSLIIIPVIKAAFGMGGGIGEDKSEDKSSEGGGGGLGCRISPIAILVIMEDEVKLVSLEDNKGSMEKLLDNVPDLIKKISDNRAKSKKDKEEQDN